MIIDFIERIPEFFSPWVYVPLLFLSWLLFALGIKEFVLRRFLVLAKRTTFQFDDVLINSLSTPLSIFIFALGFLLTAQILPLNADWTFAIRTIFQCLFIAAIVVFIDRFLSGLIRSYQAKIQTGVSPTIVKVLIHTFVYGTGALIFLGTIGISITPVLASLGLGSLAVGLALQDTLANLFSGIHIAFDKPVRIGDYIKLQSGEEGYITEIGWRSTRILRLENNMIVIPNTKLTSAIITNFYLPDRETAVLVNVNVHYQSDLQKVERVAVEAAREAMKKMPGKMPNFDPFIRFGEFASGGIIFTVILRACEFVDQYLLKHEFMKLLHARFRKERIKFSYGVGGFEVNPKSYEEYFQNESAPSN